MRRITSTWRQPSGGFHPLGSRRSVLRAGSQPGSVRNKFAEAEGELPHFAFLLLASRAEPDVLWRQIEEPVVPAGSYGQGRHQPASETAETL